MKTHAYAMFALLLVACAGSNASNADEADTGTKSSSPVNGDFSRADGSVTGGSVGPANAGAGTHGGSGSSGGGPALVADGGGVGARPIEAGAAGASDAGPSATSAEAGVADGGGTGDGGPQDTTPPTGTFPAISDPWAPGPFAVATTRSAGPSRNATVLHPRELGKDGLKHPIVVWDNGAGQTGLSIYGDLLNHLASHGFAVYAAYSATDGGQELLEGLDWMSAQAEDSMSPFYQKLDTSKMAAMGHSQGSIATFAVAGDPRLSTTLHLSGGTNPDIAEGHKTLANLQHPAAFLCGEPGGDGLIVGDTASAWCAYDFEHTDVPVFLVQITGASHISAPGMTLGACAAWLRWQLMGDKTMRMQFAGDDCVLCMRPNWMTQSKGL